MTVSGDTVVSHTEPPHPHVSVLLSHSFGSPRRPESRGDESFRGSVSPGQRGSLGPGDRPHHEHDKWPSLPGKHPVGYCSVGRRKHHHSGETTSQTGKRKQPRLLNDIYVVPLPVLRLVFNIDDHLLARYLSDPWSQLTGFTPCRSVWHTDSSEALFLPPQ